jgi:hypothetical protein
MITHRITTFLIALVLPLVCLSCAAPSSGSSPTAMPLATATPVPPSARLLGHWENTENGDIMSFYAEGTMTYASSCGLSIGDYRFLEDDLIRVDMRPQRDETPYSRVLELRMEGDTLELVSIGQNSSLKLKRTSSRNPQTASTACSTEQPQ